MKTLRPIMILSVLMVLLLGTAQPAAAATIKITSGKPKSPVTAYEPYPTHTFNASGGTAPYSVSLRSGSIPIGMSLSSTLRTLKGTPVTPGSYTFGIRITDKNGFYADQDVTVVVVAPTIRITSGTPTSPWYTGQPYPTHTFNASGGTAPYSATLRSGSIPIGMSLSSTLRTLKGTPVTPGSYTFGVRIIDKNSFFADQDVTVVIADPATTITSGAPRRGTVGKAYSFKFTATGDSNIKFSLSAGNLPGGLTLAQNGLLSGKPEAEGSSTFTVKATGTATSATVEVTLVIDPPPPPSKSPSKSPSPSPSSSSSPSSSPSSSSSPASMPSHSADLVSRLSGTGSSVVATLLLAGAAIVVGAILLVVVVRRRRSFTDA